MVTSRLPTLFLVVALVTACSTPDATTIRLLDQIDYETQPGAGEPNLYALANGDVLMSWLSDTDGGNALLVALRSGGSWTEPSVAYQSDDMFANWADFPSITVTADGKWIVHWLEKTAAAPYAYHARLSRSADRGSTWSAPLTIHSDRSPTEHGFVSMVPATDGTVDMIWLDGRVTGDRPRGPMQVRHAVFDGTGMVREAAVDERVCDCCQTALTRTNFGLVAAYRDRSDGEIRDIAVRVERDGTWSDPVHVGSDEWHIEGCPVNGPALAATESAVAITWFTAPNRQEKVQIAFSEDAGVSFGQPVRIDAGAPLGRVDVEFLDDSTALAIWLERVGEEAEIRGVTVGLDGSVGHPLTIASTSQARQSGFPRLVRSGDELLIAHRSLRENGNTIRVRAAAIQR